ncbi:MAG TPA: HAMP domain-containing protein [Polyangiaceae bacterium]|nr:HAMP domain-containing protein [Polyangiaceae bacterium]
MASRLAVVIFALVAGVSLVVAFELTERERQHNVESKERAGRMLTELFAASVAPALDFADSDAVTSSLGMLARNREVVDAAVWSAAGDAPLASLRPATRLTASDRKPGARRALDHIDISVPARDPNGKTLGTVWVRVSLASENAAFASARTRIFWLAFVLSGVIAALLVALVRRTIISPLAKLERAARRLARGELVELVDLRRDEIGTLGHTFNHMGRVLREREERIVAVNLRLQGLLDHMRQAIVVFDGEGRLGSERSRAARELCGHGASACKNVIDLLYPSGRASEIEREAFTVWLAEAAKTPPSDFEELLELAPREANLTSEHGDARLFELEFRAAASDDGEPRIMLLATDVTSQRKLERSAEAREREHQKQLTAMRRLLAGGGQVFVRFLASARLRLRETARELERDRALGPEVVESVFRFVHTLRAEARSFDLGSVETLALGLELELAGARHAPAASPLRAAARAKLVSGCGELERELQVAEALFVESSPIGRRVLEQVTVSREDVSELYRRFGGRKDELGRLVSRLAARPFGELLSALPDSVQRWATKEGKRVELSVEGRETLVPAELSERLGGVLAHLLRNAVAHGIEPPAERREKGKLETGRIDIGCREVPGGVAISLADDGQGFDEDALGRATADGSRQNALEIAFLAGVSTRTQRDELAGSGVGLGAVREELQKAGYLVRMDSARGKGATARIEPGEARLGVTHG